jgi:hypothetical protein
MEQGQDYPLEKVSRRGRSLNVRTKEPETEHALFRKFQESRKVRKGLELGGSNATQKLCIANNTLIGYPRILCLNALLTLGPGSPIAGSGSFENSRVYPSQSRLAATRELLREDRNVAIIQ